VAANFYHTSKKCYKCPEHFQLKPSGSSVVADKSNYVCKGLVNLKAGTKPQKMSRTSGQYCMASSGDKGLVALQAHGPCALFGAGMDPNCFPGGKTWAQDDSKKCAEVCLSQIECMYFNHIKSPDYNGREEESQRLDTPKKYLCEFVKSCRYNAQTEDEWGNGRTPVASFKKVDDNSQEKNLMKFIARQAYASEIKSLQEYGVIISLWMSSLAKKTSRASEQAKMQLMGMDGALKSYKELSDSTFRRDSKIPVELDKDKGQQLGLVDTAIAANEKVWDTAFGNTKKEWDKAHARLLKDWNKFQQRGNLTFRAKRDAEHAKVQNRFEQIDDDKSVRKLEKLIEKEKSVARAKMDAWHDSMKDGKSRTRVVEGDVVRFDSAVDALVDELLEGSSDFAGLDGSLESVATLHSGYYALADSELEQMENTGLRGTEQISTELGKVAEQYIDDVAAKSDELDTALSARALAAMELVRQTTAEAKEQSKHLQDSQRALQKKVDARVKEVEKARVLGTEAKRYTRDLITVVSRDAGDRVKTIGIKMKNMLAGLTSRWDGQWKGEERGLRSLVDSSVKERDSSSAEARAGRLHAFERGSEAATEQIEEARANSELLQGPVHAETKTTQQADALAEVLERVLTSLLAAPSAMAARAENATGDAARTAAGAAEALAAHEAALRAQIDAEQQQVMKDISDKQKILGDAISKQGLSAHVAAAEQLKESDRQHRKLSESMAPVSENIVDVHESAERLFAFLAKLRKDFQQAAAATDEARSAAEVQESVNKDTLAERSRVAFGDLRSEVETILDRAGTAGQKALDGYKERTERDTAGVGGLLEADTVAQAALRTGQAKSETSVHAGLSAAEAALGKEPAARDAQSKRVEELLALVPALTDTEQDLQSQRAATEENLRSKAQEALEKLMDAQAADVAELDESVKRWTSETEEVVAAQAAQGEQRFLEGQATIEQVLALAKNQLVQGEKNAGSLEGLLAKEDSGKKSVVSVAKMLATFVERSSENVDRETAEGEEAAQALNSLATLGGNAEVKREGRDREIATALRDMEDVVTQEEQQETQALERLRLGVEGEVGATVHIAASENHAAQSDVGYIARGVKASEAQLGQRFFQQQAAAAEQERRGISEIAFQAVVDAQTRASEVARTASTRRKVTSQEHSVGHEAGVMGTAMQAIVTSLGPAAGHEQLRQAVAALAHLQEQAHTAELRHERTVGDSIQRTVGELEGVERGTASEAELAYRTLDEARRGAQSKLGTIAEDQAASLGSVSNLVESSGSAIGEVERALQEQEEELQSELRHAERDSQVALHVGSASGAGAAEKAIHVLAGAQVGTDRLAERVNATRTAVVAYRAEVQGIFAALGMELDLERVEQAAQASMATDTPGSLLNAEEELGHRVQDVMAEITAKTSSIRDHLASAVASIAADASLSEDEKRRRIQKLRRMAEQAQHDIVTRSRAAIAEQMQAVASIDRSLSLLDSLAARAAALANNPDAAGAQRIVAEIREGLAAKMRLLRGWLTRGEIEDLPAAFFEVGQHSVVAPLTAALAKALAVRSKRARLTSRRPAPWLRPSDSAPEALRLLAANVRAADRARDSEDWSFAHAIGVLPALLKLQKSV
jgi:hypothetical protein